LDFGGATAARGTVNEAMLGRLLEHPYFHRQPPRSAWCLDFGANYAEQALDDAASLPKADTLASLTAFTTEAITRSIRDHVTNLDNISTLIASGEGVRNPTLMKALRDPYVDNDLVGMSNGRGQRLFVCP